MAVSSLCVWTDHRPARRRGGRSVWTPRRACVCAIAGRTSLGHMRPSTLRHPVLSFPPRADHAAMGAPHRSGGRTTHQRVALLARARPGVRPPQPSGRSRPAVVLDRGDAAGAGPASRGDARRRLDGRRERDLRRHREELLRRTASHLRRGARDPTPARIPHDALVPLRSFGQCRRVRDRGGARVRSGGCRSSPRSPPPSPTRGCTSARTGSRTWSAAWRSVRASPCSVAWSCRRAAAGPRLSPRSSRLSS